MTNIALPGRRPLFQPGDEVEAFSNGVWHEARVDSRVGKGQYLVVYKSLVDAADPSKPLREITRAFQIRRRAPSPPNPNSNIRTPPAFQPGDEVEVKTRSKGFIGGWYEARVDSCSPSGQYLVVHYSLTDDNSQPLRETVPSWDLRPHPPPRPCDKLVIQEPVDVFYRDGWWSGSVRKISKEGSHYTVYAPRLRLKIVSKTELVRPRLRWVDEDWVPAKKTKITGSGSIGKATTVTSTQLLHTFRSTSACDNEALPNLLSETKKTEGSNFRAQVLSFRHSKNAKDGVTKDDSRWSTDSLGGLSESSGQGEIGRVTGKRRKNYIPQKCATQKRKIIGTKTPILGDSVGDHQESKLVDWLSDEGNSTLSTQGGTTQKLLDQQEFPNTITSIPHSSLLGTSNSQDQHDEALLSPSKGDTTDDLIAPLSNGLNSEVMITSIPHSSLLGTSNSQDQHDEALLSPSKGDTTDDLIAPLSNGLNSEVIALPFEKRSPMWKYIDLEVTPKMRQQPHFRPLEQSPKMQREGIAVGLMVTYEYLMNNGLKLDSSCDNLDESLKSVTDLEAHGFEVQVLRVHLEELVRVREKRKQLLQKKSETEGEVLERKEKREQLNAEVEATDKAVMALEQVVGLLHGKRSSLSVEKEENESIIAKLQTDFRLAEEELASSERKFQDLLNAVQ